MRGAALLSNGLTLSSGQFGCNLNIPGPGSKKTARFGQALKYIDTLDMNSCRVGGYAGLNMKEEGPYRQRL